MRDLRSTTSRLSWIGGVLPRIRWTVNVLYATLKDVEKEKKDGSETRRTATGEDPRSKIGLFPIKRLGGIHNCFLKLFENPVQNLIRVERMKQPFVSMGVITDASPKGWGTVKVEEGNRQNLRPIEAVEALVSQRDSWRLSGANLHHKR